jgi:hypothetical protein
LKFTLVFPSREASDLAIGLVFAPCAMWVQGNKIILNPHPEDPHYQRGDLQRLLLLPHIAKQIYPRVKPVLTLVIHTTGHGDSDDLERLLADIDEAHWRAVVVELK